MKGVVLAGGTGSRLNPLTRVTNKHLLPIYDKPMVYYPIQTLVNAGIEEILLVTGGKNAGDFLRLLGNGRDFGLKHLNYTYQEGEGGIAEALGLAEFFAAGEPICVILGDNIIENNICQAVENFREAERRREDPSQGGNRCAAIWRRGNPWQECGGNRGKAAKSKVQLCRHRNLSLRCHGLSENSPLEAFRPRRTRNHRRQQFLY